MASDLLALLDTLDGLHKDASPGEWRYSVDKCWWPGKHGAEPITTPQEAVFGDGVRPCLALTGEADDPQSIADGRWIAAAKNAYPHLAQALRTALTPTTDGEREAREALFFADRDHAAGFRCVPEPIHRALSTALNLLATERAKAADAARERDELRAALLNESGQGDPPSEGWAFADPDPLGPKPCDYGMEFRVWMKGDVLLRRTDHTPAWRTYRLNEGWCAVAFGPAYDTAREAMKAADAADAIERGAHTKVTP